MNRSTPTAIATLILLCASAASWSKGAINRIVIDPMPSRSGYVYLPGPNDHTGLSNTSLIYRGVEGNWFRASQAWEATVKPLLAGASNE